MTTIHSWSVLLRCAALTALLLATFGNHAFGEQKWGSLSGRIRLLDNVDAGELGSLVVDKSSKGLANVLVYHAPARGAPKIPAHPSYNPTAKDKVKLTMVDGRFEPRILLLRTSQTMIQENRDQKAHNAHISFIKNSPM